MKKRLISLLLAAAVLLCTGCSGTGSKNDTASPEKLQETIASAGVEAVVVEVGEISWGRYGGQAQITAQVPNYTELFTAAYKTEDPDRALAAAIKLKDYTTVTYTGYAPVTVENGDQVVNSDDVVKGFIEQELIKAINAVYDAENGSEVSQ